MVSFICIFGIHSYASGYPLVLSLASCQYIDMVCVYCQSKTKTTNSRRRADGSVWRRHHCLRCQADFSSREEADLEASHRVLKRNGDTEPFYREKLFWGLVRALEHRPLAAIDAGALTSTITARLLALHKPLITSADIYAQALDCLEHFDGAALARYQAFARR